MLLTPICIYNIQDLAKTIDGYRSQVGTTAAFAVRAIEETTPDICRRLHVSEYAPTLEYGKFSDYRRLAAYRRH
jgi:hypothetical protein